VEEISCYNHDILKKTHLTSVFCLLSLLKQCDVHLLTATHLHQTEGSISLSNTYGYNLIKMTQNISLLSSLMLPCTDIN